MTDKKVKPYNWRFHVDVDQKRAIERFRKSCIRLGTDPLDTLLPAINQHLAEYAEQIGNLHLMTTEELQDEIQKRFGFRLDKQTFYDKRKTWAEGIDYFRSMHGNKPAYAYNVEKVWPRLMNHLKKHGRPDIEHLLNPENMAIPHRKKGSVVKERLPDEPEAEILDNFRPLGQTNTGWGR